MTLEQLRVYVKVVQAGSFTRAADTLQVQKSYVSRVVAALEAELGVQLLKRTSRSLSVTEAGRDFFERFGAVLAALDETVQVAHHLRGAPRGCLKLTCGVEFGLLAVAGWIDDYLAQYAQVTVDADYTSRVLDVVHEGFDLAVRIGKPEESRLVARHLGDLEYGLFACPRYLANAGAPATLEALRSHSLVAFTGGDWRRGWPMIHRASGDRRRFDASPRLRSNNSLAVRQALLHGVGIGLLPLLVAREPVADGRLVPVLPEWEPEKVPVHAVYASSRYLAPKVRAFIDLALERFPLQGAQARETVQRACAPADAPRPTPPAPRPRPARSPRPRNSAGR